ncbi:MAG: glycosyltransferase, partial [Planctomycetes bacterium]|nr:glycosyltransferase [Planctomycetota bacterium]
MAIRRILIAHNRYRWPGGEDVVVAEETRILKNAGLEVQEHFADNAKVLNRGKFATAKALWQSAWSKQSYRAMLARLEETHPQLVHAHNLWFSLTPSILAACRKQGVPVVMTLHNFRIFCAAGVLLNRKGQACIDCLAKGSLAGLLGRCYHGGYLPSLAITRMQLYNHRRRTWLKEVDRFIVPSKFCRSLFLRYGLPEDKLIVKPHSVGDPLAGINRLPELPTPPRVLYLGRLSAEKGLFTLLQAWRAVEKIHQAELRLVG